MMSGAFTWTVHEQPGKVLYVFFLFVFIAVGTVCGGRLCVSLRG